MRVEGRKEESDNEFPVGMRILAVDDDPICLLLLETLLRKCQYHVTTTSQAIRALEMLRENKNKFDLVISDVHMPDMDGFKLLELVGLEMDLPVIMLSANGDTKLVMKGITHGACDYLVKPVRMEELKNIWQHVVRRKRFDSGDHSSNSHGKNSGERNGPGSRNSNTDPKLCKKRKDQNSDDDDDDSDNENENDDPSSQKRPRVVWSVELHRKFVAAVNQLGLDKAVPKKILDLMNVEKLTRENVASHLQKYRLYLRRISSVANQQANMVAALGGPNSPYLHMTSMNLHGFNGSPQFQNNALRSVPVPPSGVLGRLNIPASLGVRGIAPSSMAQLSHHGQMPRQSNLLPGHQSGSVRQSRPTSLEFNQLQHKNAVLSGSTNSLHGSFGINSDLTPNLLDHNRCNGNWPNATENTSLDIPINISGQSRLQDSRMDGQCQAGFGLMGNNMAQTMSYAPKQVWDDNRMDLLNQADFLDGSGNTSMGLTHDSFPCMPVLNRNTGFGAMAQPRVESIGMENNQMFEKLKHAQFMEQGRSLGDYGNNGVGSLEDVVTAMFKQEQDHVEEWRFPM